jgi:hypothetical protein
MGVLVGRHPTNTPQITRFEGLHRQKGPYAIALSLFIECNYICAYILENNDWLDSVTGSGGLI